MPGETLRDTLLPSMSNERLFAAFALTTVLALPRAAGSCKHLLVCGDCCGPDHPPAGSFPPPADAFGAALPLTGEDRWMSS
jgi:hypothetical protein